MPESTLVVEGTDDGQEESSRSPAITEAAGAQALSFGLLDHERAMNNAGLKASETGPLRAFIFKLGETLARAATDVASLQVSTWVAGDLRAATIQGDKVIGAELRACTQHSLDGDTVVLIPEREGEVDSRVWEIHSSMVRQAQETRAELLKTLVSAAAAFPHLTR